MRSFASRCVDTVRTAFQASVASVNTGGARTGGRHLDCLSAFTRTTAASNSEASEKRRNHSKDTHSQHCPAMRRPEPTSERAATPGGRNRTENQDN